MLRKAVEGVQATKATPVSFIAFSILLAVKERDLRLIR